VVCPKGIKCSIPISDVLRRSDKLYRVVSDEELERIQKKSGKKSF